MSFGSTVGQKYTAMCVDGKVRVATTTAEPDTFFTVPARVSVRGKTVTGHIYNKPYDAPDSETTIYRFSAYTYRKNGYLLPPSTEEK